MSGDSQAFHSDYSHTNEYLREAREEEASGGSATSHPRTTHHKLNERERKQAALPILIFGYPLAKEGLARLRSELTCPSNGSSKTSPNKTARAAALLLQRALRDKVFSVYSQANEVVRTLFHEFVPDRVCAAEVGRCLEKLLPELLRACGDPAPRVHSTAQHTVLTVAECPHVRQKWGDAQRSYCQNCSRLVAIQLQEFTRLLNTPCSLSQNVLMSEVGRCLEKLLPELLQACGDPAPRVHSTAQHTVLTVAECPHVSGENTPSCVCALSESSARAVTSRRRRHEAGATLAPSLSGSFTSNKTKSSLKKSPTKKYTPARTAKDFSNYPGYNKLRLDSATSPKHSPRSLAANIEKVFVYRRTHRNTENRHSMIHYDHEPSKPQLKERPITVYEPLHIDYRDSPSLGSPKTKNDRSMDSLPMDSPQMSRNDLRCDSDSRSLDSPKIKADYFRENALESPKLVAGLRNMHLDEHSGMDESGYYSPGRRNQASSIETQYEADEGGSDACGENISESVSLHTTCTWCGRRVRADALEAHYWRRCVMLARCPHCRVALEARMLHSHLLALGMDEWKCPYCFKNVLARDLPWQRHLMQCPRNPRISQAS
ncbi:Uncharacterized protein OBRU01_17087 [Operophtera brumata]|uniref:Centrosomal protein CEP104 Zn finger domain-containing protein n=1 Tax=Operophtera brumata TaxID=104452 RepID=A0A0L7L1E3_OPEBR|nr:Uncharacterized protein OBRU01_17087 [Operophtera brumata]